MPARAPSISRATSWRTRSTAMTASTRSTAAAAPTSCRPRGQRLLDGGAGIDTTTAAPATTGTMSTMPATSSGGRRRGHRPGVRERQLHAGGGRRGRALHHRLQPRHGGDQPHRQCFCPGSSTAMPAPISLNGGGGADAMIGFAGDDIYYVDNSRRPGRWKVPARAMTGYSPASATRWRRVPRSS